MGYLAFEETKVWQEGKLLVKELYQAINDNTSFAHDYALANQIRRSAISIPSNIAEGFERASNKELTQFLYIAKGSSGELRTQIQIAVDLEYLSPEVANKLIEQAKAISRMLQTLINYLKNSEFKGVKYSSEVKEPESTYFVEPTDAKLFLEAQNNLHT